MGDAVIGTGAAFGVGLVLGFFYFGGLRLTVQWLTSMRSSVAIALLAMVSFIARTVVVLAGIVLVGGGQWPRYLAALVAFIIMRFTLVRMWGPAIELVDAKDDDE